MTPKKGLIMTNSRNGWLASLGQVAVFFFCVRNLDTLIECSGSLFQLFHGCHWTND